MNLKEQYDKRKQALKHNIFKHIRDFEDITGVKVVYIKSDNSYDAFTFTIFTDIDKEK